MKQDYFIVVVAHSLHGRLQRIHIPHKYLYGFLLAIAVVTLSVFGVVSSYARMVSKVSNYNHLRSEVANLRARYQSLLKDQAQAQEDLATLQLFATQVSVAYGIKKQLEGPADIAGEGRLIPTVNQSLAEYDFLKSTSLGRLDRNFARRWHTEVTPSLWPVMGRLQSHFGTRSDPFSGQGTFHAGVDISVPSGTPVHVAADGIVEQSGWMGGYGRLIVIDHGGGLSSYYAHLSEIDVLNGQEVRRGEVIGRSGASGRVTSPHLHYEIRRDGVPINPYTYLAKSPLTLTAKKDLPF